MDNNLGNVIKNPTVRAWIYGTWVIAGIILGALQVAFTDPDPLIVTQAFNVWAYLGIPVGSLAAVNSNIVPTKIIETHNIENVSTEQVIND